MRCFLGFSLVTLLSTSGARAQDIDGAVRLSLDSNVVAYVASTQSAGNGAPETTASRTGLGFSDTALGAGLGYGVTENVLIGGRLLAATSHSKVGEATADLTTFSIVPQVAYLFLQGTARPFVALHAGYSGGSTSSAGAEVSTGTWLVGPAAGVQAFVAPAFSVDLGLQVLFESGSSRLGDASFATSGYSVGLSVGLSGWLGAERKDESAAAPAIPTEVAAASEDITASAITRFTLDASDGVDGMQVALNGDPKLHADRVQVAVTWSRSEKRQGCEAIAFETEQATTPLADVRSAKRSGFGSDMESQLGTLPITSLYSLVDQAQRAWLTLCHERMALSPVAKRRIQHFLEDFERRQGAVAGSGG